MKKPFVFAWILVIISSWAAVANAEFLIINAEQVLDFIQGTPKHVIIDVRSRDEYREAHIPGAVNITPEAMPAAKARLPKDRSTPLLFYCRGVG